MSKPTRRMYELVPDEGSFFDAFTLVHWKTWRDEIVESWDITYDKQLPKPLLRGYLKEIESNGRITTPEDARLILELAKRAVK